MESIDPVLNPVLNKEIHKKGGRVLIKLGDQEIDFSPSFNIFLSTRDPTSHFTPDLCSRVTFVNFTVTPSSLTSQCLYEVLKTERPDTYKEQQTLIKAQGEFKVKLRNLEKSLLKVLNDAQGNLLDDDKIISTLETLKNEAADVMIKVKKTDEVMEEISRVSATYNVMGAACSRIYFTMEQLDKSISFIAFHSNSSWTSSMASCTTIPTWRESQKPVNGWKFSSMISSAQFIDVCLAVCCMKII